MHPRNPLQGIDFSTLYDKFDEFKSISTKEDRKVFVRWRDPNCQRILTKVLLKSFCGLEWDMPSDRLVPPAPNRLNYILLVQDLIASWLPGLHTTDKSCGIIHQAPVIVDIGTGASCIFPLLGASVNGWNFIATEKDLVSAASAASLVRANGLQSKIHVLRVDDTTPMLAKSGDITLLDDVMSSTAETSIIPGAVKAAGERWPAFSAPTSVATDSITKDTTHHVGYNTEKALEVMKDFNDDLLPTSAVAPKVAAVMCNPPFFSTEVEALNSMQSHEFSTCAGATHEMVCPGGEVSFVGQMIRESATIQHDTLWFTSMLGKKYSLIHLKKVAEDAGATVVRMVPLIQATPTISASTIIPSRSDDTTMLPSWEQDVVGDEAAGAAAVVHSGVKRQRQDIDTDTSDTLITPHIIQYGFRIFLPELARAASADGDGVAVVPPLAFCSAGWNMMFPCAQQAEIIRLDIAHAEALHHDARRSVIMGMLTQRIEEALRNVSVSGPDVGQVTCFKRVPAGTVACLKRDDDSGSENVEVAYRILLSNAPSSALVVELLISAHGEEVTVTMLLVTATGSQVRAIFERFCDRMRADICRTSRKWRRNKHATN